MKLVYAYVFEITILGPTGNEITNVLALNVVMAIDNFRKVERLKRKDGKQAEIINIEKQQLITYIDEL